jgi:hypothetical protein
MAMLIKLWQAGSQGTDNLLNPLNLLLVFLNPAGAGMTFTTWEHYETNPDTRSRLQEVPNFI